MGRRLFIVIGIILAILAVAAVGIVLYTRTSAPAEPAPQEGAVVQPTEEPMVEVIVAVQPIPRGGKFVQGSLGRTSYPAVSVPPSAIKSETETIGKIASSEIVQGQIIVQELLREETLAFTNEAAFDVPPGHVMVAFPINQQSSVAYAIQPGDVVDVLMTFSLVDLDPDFQTILPNKFSFLLESGEGENSSVSLSAEIDNGRLVVRDDKYPGYEFPREDQRPRRVALLTVQKAKVIKVGDWLGQGQAGAAEAAPAEEGVPTPTPTRPNVVSLAVMPHDALVLLWARQSRIYMELAMRAAGDEDADHTIEAVSLQYMLTRFNIAVPPKASFGIDKSQDAVTASNEPVFAPPSGE
ncbi:MAG TPA: hypothetical protein G4N96_11290 [Chloroflexi bacterium]|nr:MAG: hypothetical protein B6I38_05950 [Anaerolineaceae bacterium 4572_5.1]HEY85679.1 hypothetical protein [Chloroflexota bacterium]